MSETLNTDGFERLVAQVQLMVEQSGDPTVFDAANWLTRWLDEPSPALAGAKPASYMGTLEGQETVSRLLAQMQSGAFS